VSQAVDWVAIGPAVCLVGAAVVALLGDALAPATRRWLPTSASLVGIGAALALTLVPAVPRRTFCISAHPGRSGASAAGPVGCSWNVDHATVVWWGAVLLGAALVVLLLQPLAASGELPAGELHLLVLSSATGALAIAASGDLVTLLVGIELVSLPAFAMVGLRATSRGAEAALKLFLYSVVATALSLLGIAMVYGATGSLVAAPVALAGSSGSAVSPVIGMGMVLTLVALAPRCRSTRGCQTSTSAPRCRWRRTSRW
jgi:NADH-quinone oxidoreductase subunit N